MAAINNIIRMILLVAAIAVFIPGMRAKEKPVATADTTTVRESIFGDHSRSLAFSHFTWGAELGSSIDLRGNNMSTFDIDVILGYKSRFLRTIGIGAGVHRSFGSKNNFIPVYFLLRTSFRDKPSLFFFDLKAGYSFNTINSSAARGGVSASLGVGINLAMSKKFQSHIVLSYCYFHINGKTRSEVSLPSKYVDLARLSLGVNF